jgi:aminomethyltransferase
MGYAYSLWFANKRASTHKKICSLFDVSHMAVVDVIGSDGHTFLLKLLANNINKLQHPGQALYSCMLNHQGGIIDDLIVYKMHDFYRLVINASTALSDLSWMRANAVSFNALNIIPRRFDIPENQSPLVLLAIQGPHSVNTLAQLFPEVAQEILDISYFGFKIVSTVYGQLMISRTGYTGEDGFELFIPYKLGLVFWDLFINLGVLPAGLGAEILYE